jgi:hypothetical protein
MKMAAFKSTLSARRIPVVYFPRRPNEPPDPVPYLMTGADLIRFAQLDLTDVKDPERTLAYYRGNGKLKSVQIGRELRYKLPDAIDFADRLQDENPR